MNNFDNVRSLRFKKKAIAASFLISAQFSPMLANAAIEEVIVTANKRAQTANEVGLSITAISGEKLAEQKLTSLEDITSTVPGLTFATSQQNTPILTLRGVGFNESSLGVYPATSLYVDEIPLPFPVMAAHSAYDLERVEVLKGPQGVLFGQNSTGGAINFIAAKPTDEVSYGGDLSYGRFDRVEANGFISGGLSDTVSARLAIQSVYADDWQESVTTDQENGEEEYTAARLSLRFAPSDTTELNFNLNGWTDKSDPQASQFIAAVPKRFDSDMVNPPLQFAHPFAKEEAESADWSFENSGDKEFFQASVRGEFELNEELTLTTIVAHSEYEQNQVQDGDGYALSTADFLHTKGDIESTFAEIRLTGDADRMAWVIGTNYEDSSTYEDQLLQLLNSTSNRAGVSINRSGTTNDQDIQSYAFFGNIDYEVTEDLTFKAGARYTDTEIDGEVCFFYPLNAPGEPDISGTGLNSNGTFTFNFLGTLAGVPFDPIEPYDCAALNGPTLAGVPGFPFKETLAEDNVSWRLGLDWDVNEDALVYANISQGYKAGSFPTIAAATHIQLAPVTEESVLAYEAGFKVSLAENNVQWNGAVFHYDYEDKQVRGKLLDPVFGTLDRLVNVPESTISGVETDIVAQLTEGLTLTAAVTYVSSEVDKYVGYDVLGNLRDLSGNDLPLTPEFTYSLDLDYRTALSSGGTLFMGINLVGQTDSDGAFDADDITLAYAPAPGASPVNGLEAGFHKSITENYLEIDGYSTIGARIGYESNDGRWKLMLWGKNITDEYYWNAVNSSSEAASRVAGRPRTYGVTVGYQY